MSMSKQDFVALADEIREHNYNASISGHDEEFTTEQIERLAHFCKRSNPRFMYDRWLGYIAGECGPNGGTVKKVKVAA